MPFTKEPVHNLTSPDHRDPRRLACESKHFSIRPVPIDQYLVRLRLPLIAYHAFWLHWDIGKRNGNFLSEITLSEVATRLGCDESSVTRAYQRLRQEGLLRRQSPGRDPADPHREPTAITEVTLPSELLKQILSAPDRRQRAAIDGQSTQSTVHTVVAIPASADTRTEQTTAAGDSEAAAWVRPHGALRIALRALSRMSPQERRRYEAFRERKIDALEWDPDTALTPEECEVTLMTLRQARLTPVQTPRPSTPALRPSIAVQGPRRLSSFTQAQIRSRLVQYMALKKVPIRLLEITWAIETGSLRKHPVLLAINIALKKVRERLWTRPYRMPPHFQLQTIA
jgi:hypothetical protein